MLFILSQFSFLIMATDSDCVSGVKLTRIMSHMYISLYTHAILDTQTTLTDATN